MRIFARTLLLCAVISGCKPLDQLFVDQPVDPACQTATASVAGEWVLVGTGERSGCDNRTFNTSFFDLQSLPLTITQNDDRLTFSPAEPVDGFALVDAFVDGQCVQFRTSEDTPDGTIIYEWLGVVSDDGERIEGQFTGTGPVGCESRGNFRIDL